MVTSSRMSRGRASSMMSRLQKREVWRGGGERRKQRIERRAEARGGGEEQGQRKTADALTQQSANVTSCRAAWQSADAPPSL